MFDDILRCSISDVIPALDDSNQLIWLFLQQQGKEPQHIFAAEPESNLGQRREFLVILGALAISMGGLLQHTVAPLLQTQSAGVLFENPSELVETHPPSLDIDQARFIAAP